MAEQKALMDAHNAQFKLQIDQFNAETARMKAMNDAQSNEEAKYALEQFKAQMQQETELYKAHLSAEVQLMLGQLSANTTITTAQMSAADAIVDGEDAEFKTGKDEL